MDRIYGYPKRQPDGRMALTDGAGNVIGYGHIVNCTRIEPGKRGDWISNQRCSYRFKVGDAWYAGRGYGEGMSLSAKRMKKPPRIL